MDFNQFYGYGSQNGEAEQDVSQPASPANTVAPSTMNISSDHHVAISWIGLVIAVILIRILYEVSE